MTTNTQAPIFVGTKPPMNYVLAIVTQFNSGNEEVRLRARGRAISRAVDVAEIVRNRFVEEAQVANVTIGTERIQDEKGRSTNVSTIEITLVKGEAPIEPQVEAEDAAKAEAEPAQEAAATA